MRAGGLSDPGRIGPGGRWNNGANAGVSYVNGNNVLSNRNSNIGSRLTATSDSRTRPCHLAEDDKKRESLGW